ncbi:MAG: DUF2497 domain-containing protein [Bradyrhizobiaceae bacterium]|nr:MAG: DUF2497 domain-containing protein [Bradyrhizobiaceae bacterium]
MNQPAKTQEPSMEEILASIRRIISDDETKPAAAAPAARPEPAAPPKQDFARPDAPRAEPPRAPSHASSPASKPVMAGIPPSKFAPRPAPQPAPAQPMPAPTFAQPAPAAKNSQDEIDAMLAEFDANGAGSDGADSEVFELTEQMAMPDSAGGFRKVEAADDLEFSESVTPAAPNRAPMPAPSFAQPSYAQPHHASPSHDRPAPVSAGQAMLSNATSAAVESAFNALANTVLSNNARTLEDLVREMLRPMLKSWLDDNLPGLVERIVKAEIERVARGR